MTKLAQLALSLLLFAACATPREAFIGGFNGNKPGVDLAAFELECPKDQLEIVELGAWNIGVKGCGKKATFGNHAGLWFRSDSRE